MSQRRLAVVAGTGVLPPLVALAALAAGDVVQVLALLPMHPQPGLDVRQASAGDPAALIAAVRSFGATHLVLAGAVRLTEAQRLGIAAALGGHAGVTGDVALAGLGATLRRLTGADLLGVHEIVPELLAPAGHIAGPALLPEDQHLARQALAAARGAGGLDLGQAAVATLGRVLAAEDVAGTDELLRRVAGYRETGLIGESDRLALGKAVKPQQPDFVDLPAIGPDTVVNAAAAGVRLIAIEAHRTLLLERQDLVERADRLGVSIVGLDG